MISRMQPFLDRILETPLIFDGALGTMLYARGVFINTCYDELSLTRPDLITEIHEEYVKASADAIETNSFGANRIKLADHGLAEKTAVINRRSAELARKAAGDNVYVAGSVGPCLRAGQLWCAERAGDIREAFREQISALTEGGVDLVLLETFVHLDEITLAAETARAFGLPVIASFTVGDEGRTVLGAEVGRIVADLDRDTNVDAIGINCGVGPAPAYDALEAALPLTGKPIIVKPNAGLPQEVDGRMIYMTNPEYLPRVSRMPRS